MTVLSCHSYYIRKYLFTYMLYMSKIRSSVYVISYNPERVWYRKTGNFGIVYLNYLKALILLGGFTLKGWSLAIWSRFTKFISFDSLQFLILWYPCYYTRWSLVLTTRIPYEFVYLPQSLFVCTHELGDKLITVLLSPWWLLWSAHALGDILLPDTFHVHRNMMSHYWSIWLIWNQFTMMIKAL